MATFAVNLAFKASVMVPTLVPLQKSCSALSVSLALSLVSTCPSSWCSMSVLFSCSDPNQLLTGACMLESFAEPFKGENPAQNA